MRTPLFLCTAAALALGLTGTAHAQASQEPHSEYTRPDRVLTPPADRRNDREWQRQRELQREAELQRERELQYERRVQRDRDWQRQDERDWRRPDYRGRDMRYERGAGPYDNWYRGSRLPPEYHSRHYVVEDWRGHHLSAPPRGYHWVQAGSDYLLVAIATGVIAQLLLSN